jgi:hypothetical protein
MSKKQWGNATWYLFHTLAEKLKPEYDNPAEIRLLYSHIKKICYNLPCQDCTQHSIKLLSTVNEHLITSSKANFIRFLWLFHNKVNKNTRSKEFSLEETTAIYSRAITSHIVKNFIDVMNIKTPDLKLTLIKNQSKNVYMPSFHEYINNNYYKFN